MTTTKLTPDNALLVAIDIAKHRNEVLIEEPGRARRRRISVLNTRAEHDRLIEALGQYGRPVLAGFEATGNYHRDLSAGAVRPAGDHGPDPQPDDRAGDDRTPQARH